jgi:hypothetical protein
LFEIKKSKKKQKQEKKKKETKKNSKWAGPFGLQQKKRVRVGWFPTQKASNRNHRRIGGSYASQEYGPKRGLWGVT